MSLLVGEYMQSVQPSIAAGYAHDKSEADTQWQWFWDGLAACYAPALGLTGMVLRDVGPNRLDGRITAATWSSSDKGTVLASTGGGQYVTVPSLTWAPQAFTAVILLKATVFYNYSVTLDAGSWSPGSDGMWGWFSNIGGSLVMRIRGGSDLSVQMNAVGVWGVYAQTYSSGASVGYRDGRAITSGSQYSPITAWPQFRIGEPSGDNFRGQVALVSLHSRVLNAAEITMIARDPLGMFRLRRRVWVMFSGAASQTLTPDQAAALWAALTPTLSAGPVSLTPDQGAGAWAAPDSTLSPGGVSLSPDQAAATWAALSAAVQAAVSLTVTQGAASWASPDGTLTPGPVSLSANQAAGVWASPAPSLSAVVTLLPDAGSGLWAAPVPGILGEIGLAPDQAAGVWAVPAPGLLGEATLLPGPAAGTWAALVPTATPGVAVLLPAQAAASWAAQSVGVLSEVGLAANQAAATWAALDASPGTVVTLIPGAAPGEWAALVTDALGEVALLPGSASGTWAGHGASAYQGTLVVSAATAAWLAAVATALFWGPYARQPTHADADASLTTAEADASENRADVEDDVTAAEVD